VNAVDHAAEAIRIVDEFGTVRTPAINQASAFAAAQVHATLALVEQQRIANVIALASLRFGPNELPPLRHLAIVPHGLSDVQPAPGIREGLGLA
jgi:hypothetical protein